MPYLYPHRQRDRPALSPTTSWDDYTVEFPTQPAPAAIDEPHDGVERAPRRDVRSDRSRRHERGDGEQRRKKPRTESQERRRREHRTSQDPEREARRQERRRARQLQRDAARQIDTAQASAQPDAGDRLGPNRDSNTDVSDTSYSSPVDSASDLRRGDSAAVRSRDVSRSRALNDHRMGERQSRGNDEARRCSRRPREPRTESWTSMEEDWTFDLESSKGDSRTRHRARTPSMFDELDWYKRTSMPDPAALRRDERRCRACTSGSWSHKRKCAIFGLLALSIITFIVVIAAAVTVSRNAYSFTPSTEQVNNTIAFTSGGATRRNVNDTDDGIGAGTDAYTYYSGNASNFPAPSLWISFDDMWAKNLPTLQQSCQWLQVGKDNSPQEIADIHFAIQDRANASLVDHRLIFAMILQESHGCVRINATVSSGGVRNPGLMQSHNGHTYNAHHSQTSILAMVQDGTQGTQDKMGDGLVQLLNTYGDPYEVARSYNSGYIPSSGDLSEAAGATACYVSDIANRLTGWVNAKSSCPG